MRVKNRWQKGKGPKSLEDLAQALGFIAWQISANAVLSLENNDYETESNPQRLDIIEEFVSFLIQCADRLAYEKFSDQDRQTLITALAKKITQTLQENRVDIQGAGAYEAPFISKLNQRLSDFAECQFEDGSPGYSLYRALGNFVQPVMGPRNNRWVPDQVQDIEGPEAFKTFKTSMHNLLKGSLF